MSAPARGAPVALEGIVHGFNGVPVLRDVSLSVEAGEFVALLGPSGCGKSTLLRILAGLQRQDGGVVRIDGTPVDALSPRARGVGIVFQSYALFPHMSVLDNVCYGLEAQGMRRRGAREVARAAMERTRIGELAARMPAQLSGGQQQRVALARTLAIGPRILLLDEPLAALDKSLRLDMQIELRRLQRELGITTVMVTHDQEEAMSMADRVAVLDAGRLEQFDTPAELYDHPRTPFVAGFVGTTNMLAATLAEAGTLVLAGGTLALDGGPRDGPRGPVRAAIRPEHWEIAAEGTLPARVALSMPVGPSLLVELVLPDGTAARLSMPRTGPAAPCPGSAVALRLRPGAPVRLFP